MTVVQQSLQIEIAHQIISGLRNGSLGGPLQGKTFNKVIYAGHSYGSIAGNGLASIYPNDVDAFVFTGYTKNFIMGTVPLAAGVTLPASTVSSRFAGLDPLYLADSSVSGRQYGLYTVNGVGGFDPDILPYDLAHEGTVAVGELATLVRILHSTSSIRAPAHQCCLVLWSVLSPRLQRSRLRPHRPSRRHSLQHTSWCRLWYG